MMKPSQRLIQIVLGVIWLVDGILQFQPYMFTKSFATDTLAGVGQGQPGFVAHPVTAMAQFLTPHIAFWNAIFATIQVLIGVGLLVRRTVKPALAVSFGWVVAVWWFAEAFGQMFNGSATIVSGAPGAVLLYGIIGVLVWPTGETREVSASASGPFGDLGGRVAWAAVWMIDAVLQFLPANHAKGALSSSVTAAVSGEPSLLASISNHAGNAIHGSGPTVAILLGITEVIIGLGVFGRRPNIALMTGAALALVIWVVGQDLGGILTGQGTDPNTGPLYILLAFTCYQWPSKVAERVSERRVRIAEGTVDRLAGI